jgi:hypothetical protein
MIGRCRNRDLSKTVPRRRSIDQRWPSCEPTTLGRIIRMDSARQYREFGEECDRLANKTKTERHKNILTEMARTWRELAEKIEKDNDR